ncbi:MAG TPA: DUF2809 domain-containing protein [Saprospiraceae bacterium]|nr:DUF2809 domain-containing protein [Saprospiraceae bacterium]
MHDHFVRPYLGDVLVVILLYCLLKSFFKLPVIPAAIFVLLFSFLVEFLQFLHIVEKPGLQQSTIARIVIGTSFSWIDVLMYTIGIGIVLMVEKYWIINE